jgi:UDP-2-acetamido-2-deoxy-ribo-hexuluronate aminotransferase
MEFCDLKAGYARSRAEIEARISAVFSHGQFILGPEVAELEQALAEYVGVAHAITVSSGTQALELALRAHGIGPGHQIITQSFSWISAAEVALLVGAQPVFVDIEPRGYGLDPSRLEQAITPSTRAIVPVSLFGQMPDFEAIKAIAERHGLSLIEDGAQSFGATQRGQKSGSVRHVGCTSFFPSKPLGCYGDGGALFTDDDALASRLRALRSHGASERHHHVLAGTNARFDTLQAAVLLAKLPHLAEELGARARIAARYSERLRHICQVPEILSGNTHVYAQYTVRVPARDAVRQALTEAGIPTAVYYPRCLHQQPVFAGCPCPGELGESERASREALSLPMHPYLSEADQDRVIEALERALAERASSTP